METRRQNRKQQQLQQKTELKGCIRRMGHFAYGGCDDHHDHGTYPHNADAMDPLDHSLQMLTICFLASLSRPGSCPPAVLPSPPPPSSPSAPSATLFQRTLRAAAMSEEKITGPIPSSLAYACPPPPTSSNSTMTMRATRTASSSSPSHPSPLPVPWALPS